jgi:hypothetical protein
VSVEADEDRSEVGFRRLARIRLELRLNIDDEGGADYGERTGLRMWSTLYGDKGNSETHKNQDVETVAILHVTEIEVGTVILDRMEVGSLGRYPESASRPSHSQLIPHLRNATARIDADHSPHPKARTHVPRISDAFAKHPGDQLRGARGTGVGKCQMTRIGEWYLIRLFDICDWLRMSLQYFGRQNHPKKTQGQFRGCWGVSQPARK